MHEQGVSAEQVAELPVRLRRHAALNPLAEFREPLTVDDVLASRMVSPPIHKLEAPPWSDGGACVIVASEDWARSRGLDPVVLTGWGEAHDSSNFVAFEPGLTSFPWVRESTDLALSRAGRRLDDLDVAEIYGAFAASELMTYEAMGLFASGEAPAAVARGETSVGGTHPDQHLGRTAVARATRRRRRRCWSFRRSASSSRRMQASGRWKAPESASCRPSTE